MSPVEQIHRKTLRYIDKYLAHSINTASAAQSYDDAKHLREILGRLHREAQKACKRMERREDISSLAEPLQTT